MIARFVALFLALFLIASPAAGADPDPAFEARAGDVIAYFAGDETAENIFSPSVLEVLPAARLNAVRDQLIGQFGPALSVESIIAANPFSGTVQFRFERARVEMRLAVEPETPHRIAGLLVTETEMIEDSQEAVTEEISALAGLTSLTVARLGSGNPEIILNHNGAQALAIGSTFKLYILAELIAQIQAGERQWEDVVPLTHRSLPSGILQDWPENSPLTLHSLATLMISVSDNTATDTLIALLGRENIEARMATTGHSNPSLNSPMLSTLDLFRIKAADDEALRRDWIAADQEGRRALLPRLAEIDRSRIDPMIMQGNPVLIEEAEWFASGNDLVNLLAWINQNADEHARALLAVNSGIGPSAERWAWLGYKGGSEPGVMSMSFIGRTQGGETYAVTGSWNNSEAQLEQATFATLMTRILNLLSR